MQSGGSYYRTNARNRFGKLLEFLYAHELRVADGDVARVVNSRYSGLILELNAVCRHEKHYPRIDSLFNLKGVVTSTTLEDLPIRI